MPVITDLKWYRGEDVLLKFALTPAGTIAGWSMEFSLKVLPSDAAALVVKTTGAGITITDPVNGGFTVAVAGADTAGLAAPAIYTYDVVRTDAGARSVLATGQVLLQAGTTY